MQINQNFARLSNYFKRSIIGGIALILSTALFTSCSSSPSSSKAEAALEEQITAQSDGKITLASFRKTNGMEAEVMGVKTYQLAYEAKIKFSADGTWLRGPMGVSFRFSADKVAPGSITDMMGGTTPVRAGSTATLEGSMVAQKTEKGWQFVGGDCHVTKEPAR